MSYLDLFTLSTLPAQYRTALQRGGIHTITRLLLTSHQESARRCRLSPIEIKMIVDAVCREYKNFPLRCLADIAKEGDEMFSTGDSVIDTALGGGIRTGMVWEVFGESASGKTQFALQLSLFVQITPKLGGLDGSCCYLTTSSKLPTERLLEIFDNREKLLRTDCSLDHIHTITTPSITVMRQVLSGTLLEFMEQQAQAAGAKTVKLIVIDALAELFHDAEKTTTTTLVERSRKIGEIGSLLHTLAAQRKVAIVVLNEVVDAFDRRQWPDMELAYNKLSRWFSRGSEEETKEASLGLVWANQVNARIQLSRTGRRRHLADPEINPVKIRKTALIVDPASKVSGGDTMHDNYESVLVRKFTVIFSSVSPPVSLDYIVTVSGISALPDSIAYPSLVTEIGPSIEAEVGLPTLGDTACPASEELLLEPVEEDWETFWDNDEIPAEAYFSLS